MLALEPAGGHDRPSHGVIWRKDPLQIVQQVPGVGAPRSPQKRAVILYDTMWKATRQMAEAIGDGLAAEGVPYKLFHMAVTDRNDVITEIFKAQGRHRRLADAQPGPPADHHADPGGPAGA